MIRRRLLLLLATTVVLLTATGVALAFWTTSGAGTGSALTGTLAAPTNVTAVATPGSGTVSITWTASTQATGYYVSRVGTNSTSAACGTSPAQPVTATSCNDLAVADGTYHYTVTAVRVSWTATSTPSGNVTVNNTRPAVTVNQAASQADPTKTAPINFTAVFNAAVTDFTSSDVTVTPGTATAVVTGSGTTYNIAVSGLTATGTVSVSIAANTAHDAAGAGNTASTSTDNTVTYDVTAPTAVAPGATAATTSGTNPIFVNNGAVTLTDAATDTNSGVASVSYYYCAGSTGTCTSANGTLIGSSSAANFPVTSNGPLAADGPYRVIAVATDAAGNTSTPSAATLITVDTTPPTVTRPTVNGHS
ncbi:Ig-like domain-containing protein [Kribbella sp. NPDC006257]|uniref:Ig-like domain-containing protein n=1 Tax=Kribbella sp. NPDC006257 TaxID=3156738 RepID=UPI0033A98F20